MPAPAYFTPACQLAWEIQHEVWPIVRIHGALLAIHEELLAAAAPDKSLAPPAPPDPKVEDRIWAAANQLPYHSIETLNDVLHVLGRPMH